MSKAYCCPEKSPMVYSVVQFVKNVAYIIEYFKKMKGIFTKETVERQLLHQNAFKSDLAFQPKTLSFTP